MSKTMLQAITVKALVFNCSPHMQNGHTALILDPFLKGIKDGGAEIEQVLLRKLDIQPCQGDTSCWVKTPGKCHIKDDMQTIYPKIRAAGIIVFATPVYVDGMPGPMKNLVDRLISLIEVFIEVRDNHCRHKLPRGHKHSRVVLVSTCGFWEMDNFELLVGHMKAMCKNIGWEYVGAVLRPHSSALAYMLRKNLPVKDILDAAEKAGKQLATEGKMREEDLRMISREIGTREQFLEKLNLAFKDALEKIR